MLPKELEDIFSKNEYDDDDISLYITKVEDSNDVFTVDFEIKAICFDESGKLFQKWTIQVLGYVKSRISLDAASLIEIRDDHPLLWEFTDLQCQLYYVGECKDTPKLFYELYLQHKKIFGRHQCFNISFGEEYNNFKAFQYSSGLLTKGSKKLMEKYGECLMLNGLDYTIIGERAPMYWDGEKHVLEDRDIKVLLLGDSYIIAMGFSFLRKD